MTPGLPALLAGLEATWPPAAVHRAGPWAIREGRGGGGRVSAATPAADWGEADIPAAAAAMRALGQAPLFRIVPGDALDAALAARGWCMAGRTYLYCAPVARLAAAPPHLAAMTHWPPLAVTEEIWAAGGIGAARLAVMHRAAGPKTAILARTDDRPAGAAFAAAGGPVAFVHAVMTLPAHRRRGTARHMMMRAALWAEAAGAAWLALAVTAGNAPARALYEALGMAVAGQYAYRVPPQKAGPACADPEDWHQ